MALTVLFIPLARDVAAMAQKSFRLSSRLATGILNAMDRATLASITRDYTKDDKTGMSDLCGLALRRSAASAWAYNGCYWYCMQCRRR